jgi:hypothetical protein
LLGFAFDFCVLEHLVEYLVDFNIVGSFLKSSGLGFVGPNRVNLNLESRIGPKEGQSQHEGINEQKTSPGVKSPGQDSTGLGEVPSNRK